MNKEEFKKDTGEKIDKCMDIVRNDKQKNYKLLKELLRDIDDSLCILCIDTPNKNNFRKYILHELNENLQNNCVLSNYSASALDSTIYAIKNKLGI
jgi:hypothetical protein